MGSPHTFSQFATALMASGVNAESRIIA